MHPSPWVVVLVTVLERRATEPLSHRTSSPPLGVSAHPGSEYCTDVTSIARGAPPGRLKRSAVINAQGASQAARARTRLCLLTTRL